MLVGKLGLSEGQTEHAENIKTFSNKEYNHPKIINVNIRQNCGTLQLREFVRKKHFFMFQTREKNHI
jgi:hypothetical protein